MKSIRRLIIMSLFAGAAFQAVSAKPSGYVLTSPDGYVRCTVSTDGGLSYRMSYHGTEVICESKIALDLGNGTVWDGREDDFAVMRRRVSGTIDAQFYTKKKVKDRYNMLTIDFGMDYAVEFRAYDEGLAWRFSVKRNEPFRIYGETAQFNFVSDMQALAAGARFTHKTDPWQCTFEAMYTSLSLSEAETGKLYYSPLLVKGEDAVFVIAESDVLGYPGMFIGRGERENSLEASFSNYPEKMYPRNGHQTHYIMEYSDEIARISGPRTLPWRIICTSDNESGLLSNDMVYRLAAPSKVEDTSWIHPGMAVWDYWNNWNGVGNGGWTMTYDDYVKYIDIAAAHGIPYYMLDGGWGTRSVCKMEWRDPVRLPELVQYARSKGVGIVLWCGASLFSAYDMEALCKEYSEIGVAGFKIDFWDHDNQRIMERMEAAAAMAAKYGLIVDFHGCTKPSGFNRTYPNVLSFEGVRGMEYKIIGSGNYDMAAYNLQFPFIRSLAGPADLTPGAMVNRPVDAPVVREEASIGTRCHQIALFIVTYSPFHCACDSPARYGASESNSRCLSLIGQIPSVWDETVVLSSALDSHILIARRSGEEWFIGGICGRQPCNIDFRPGFLKGGGWEMEMYTDAPDADLNPENYDAAIRPVSGKTRLEARMSPAGGFVARIYKKR